MKTKQMLVTAGMAAVFCLGAANLLAQNNGGGGGGGGGGRQGRGNFDPAQFQQQMMDRTRERLEVTDDNEWKALQPLVQKVMDARMASFGGGRGGMMGGRNRGGGGNGGNNAGGGGNNAGGGRFGTPSPEAEALQKAIEAKASNSELKAALAKYVEARKAKQAELEKAQTDLRKVLSVRQEAIATESGLL